MAVTFRTYFRQQLQASVDGMQGDLKALNSALNSNMGVLIRLGESVRYRLALDHKASEWKKSKATAKLYWDSPTVQSGRAKTAFIGFLALCLVATIYTFLAPVSLPLTITLGSTGTLSGGVVLHQLILNAYRKNICEKIVFSLGENHVARIQIALARRITNTGIKEEVHRNKYVQYFLDFYLDKQVPYMTVDKAIREASDEFLNKG